MFDDRREMSEGRFRELLVKWLAKLPADGWEGTSHELGYELDSFAERHRLFAFVPICPGRKVAGMVPFLSAHGFILSHHRTKRARTLRFARVPTGGDA